MSVIGTKGVSPLIASVFLIAITVTTATLFSGWVSSASRTTQVSAENKTAEAVECAAAVITIDQVYVQGGIPNRIRVVVRNSGQANDLEITNVSVVNATGTVFSYAPMPMADFDRGEAYVFEITNSSGPAGGIAASCPSGFSKAIVTTNCGGISAIFDRAPRCA